MGELVIYDNFQWEDKSFFFSILVAARSNRGLSFVGSAGRELGEGSLMVRPHLCKSAVRAGDNQGLHTITPTHLSSGGNLGCSSTPARTPLGRQRKATADHHMAISQSGILCHFECYTSTVLPLSLSLSKLCWCDIGVYSCRFMWSQKHVRKGLKVRFCSIWQQMVSGGNPGSNFATRCNFAHYLSDRSKLLPPAKLLQIASGSAGASGSIPLLQESCFFNLKHFFVTRELLL